MREVSRSKYDRDISIVLLFGVLIGIALLGLVLYAESQTLPHVVGCHDRLQIAKVADPELATAIIEFYKGEYNIPCWVK